MSTLHWNNFDRLVLISVRWESLLTEAACSRPNFVRALWDEIDLLGNTVLQAMRKVLSVSRITAHDTSVEDLLGVFESEVDPVMDEIRRIGGMRLAQISGEPEGCFERKATLARKDWKIKIKLLRAEIMEAERDVNRAMAWASSWNTQIDLASPNG